MRNGVGLLPDYAEHSMAAKITNYYNYQTACEQESRNSRYFSMQEVARACLSNAQQSTSEKGLLCSVEDVRGRGR